MIAFILKATIALVIFYAFYHAFLVKESMFRFNRFYLIFALCFSLIVPFIQLSFGFHLTENLFPENSAVLTTEKSASGQENTPVQPPALEKGEMGISLQVQPTPPFNWNTLFTGIYLLGLTFFLIRFIIQLVQLIRITRNNPTIKENACTYVLLMQKTLPFTFLNFLFVEKETFLKKAIEKEILFHELAQIRQKHSWDILFVEFLRIAFWFNPLYLH